MSREKCLKINRAKMATMAAALADNGATCVCAIGICHRPENLGGLHMALDDDTLRHNIAAFLRACADQLERDQGDDKQGGG